MRSAGTSSRWAGIGGRCYWRVRRDFGGATSIEGMADAAGIVLAGGRSTRMGTPKAALEWHGSTLLRHVVGLVARGVEGRVVVVRAAGQALPSLPAGVEVAQDAREGRGPLQGL